ncbi:unnamed protein product [Timema podura]|uniref:Uncharacterized protein n=1 Tax=Timema podura TaxID=61482 RepID=A0ABN7P3J9_TIMPD|nr:unnamed protein product [Timema podura]
MDAVWMKGNEEAWRDEDNKVDTTQMTLKPQGQKMSKLTTLAMEEVESVSTTTLVPGTRGMGAILFLVRRNFFFFRTLVMRAGPLFFLPATTEWELSPRNATQHS